MAANDKATKHNPSISKAQQHKHLSTTLVPPPPPTTPVAATLSWSETLEMLSEQDLRTHKQALELQLSNQRISLEQKTANLKEKRQRSELFSSLYKEGVVSRKEYESSCHESLDAETPVKETLEKISEQEQRIARIDQRLKELTRSSAKSAATSKVKYLIKAP
ncbi:MAG: hypothetical protein HY711_04130 [Candidatus Melainabacteria bacterium]|nr:hypothetical protein [Candidatus Melainabacteria bacterium]